MKIQSIIRRKNGTTVDLGGTVYFFSPANDHVCDVENEAHAERFLSIKEGFRPVEQPNAKKAEPEGGEEEKSQVVTPEGGASGQQPAGDAESAPQPKKPGRKPGAAKAKKAEPEGGE